MPEETLRLGIDPRPAVQGAREFGRATDRAAGSAFGLDRAVRQLAAAFSVYSAARVVGSAIRASIAWEQSLTGVAKTVEATEAQIAALGIELRQMSEEIPVAANELAGIAEAAGQLGIQTDSIIAFTRVMADLGVTTNLTSEQAATSFARLANIMGTPQDAFDRLGSTVVDLGNNLATTEAEITEFATRMAGAGRIAGLTEANILAIGGAMSSVGIEAEAGGTAVQKALIDINTAVATGNENLAKFASTAGMSSEAFRTAWREDAGTAFTAFVEGLGQAGDRATTVLDDLGLSNQRLVRAFLSLANAGPLLRQSIDRANTAWEENNALTEEASRFYETTGNRIVTLKNRMRDFGVEAVTSSGAVGDVVGSLEGFADFLEENDDLAGAATTTLGLMGDTVVVLSQSIQGLVILYAKWVDLIERADRFGDRIFGTGEAEKELSGFEQGLVATIEAQRETNELVERGKDFVRGLAAARADEAAAATEATEAARGSAEAAEEEAKARQEALDEEIDLLARAAELGLAQVEQFDRMKELQTEQKRIAEDVNRTVEERVRAKERELELVRAIANEDTRLTGRLPRRGDIRARTPQETVGAIPLVSEEALDKSIRKSALLTAHLLDLGDAEDDAARTAQQAFHGLVSVADGLGLVDGASRDALRGVSDIVSSFRETASGGLEVAGVGGWLGIAGGVAGLVGSLFSNEDEERIREARRRWRDALDAYVDELTDRTRFEQLAQDADEKARELFRGLLAATEFIAPTKGLDEKRRAALNRIIDNSSIEEIAAEFERMEDVFGPEGQEVFANHRRRLERIAEQRQAEIRAMEDDYAVRLLVAQGRDSEAESMRRELEQQAELAEAFELGGDALRDYVASVHDAEDAAYREARAAERKAAADREAAEAAREAAAAVDEANRRARTRSDFETDLFGRRAELSGDPEEAIRARHFISANQELAAARELVDQGIITRDMYFELARVLGDELNQKLADFAARAEEAARAAEEAARAEQFRAQVDQENLRIRLLTAQGQTREALIARQQLEIIQAMEDGRNAEYIAMLQQVHAIDLANEAQRRMQEGVRNVGRAADQATRRLDGLTSALNTPSGFPLSGFRADVARGFGVGSPDFTGSTTTVRVEAGAIIVQAAPGQDPREIAKIVVDEINRQGRAGGNPTASPEIRF